MSDEEKREAADGVALSVFGNGQDLMAEWLGSALADLPVMEAVTLIRQSALRLGLID